MKLDVEEVTELALKYVKNAGHPYAKVIKITPSEPIFPNRPGKIVKKEPFKWIVEVDVGTISTIIKKVYIDDNTGKVIGFD